MTHIVYKASPKALRKGVFTEDDRIVLLGDGTAMWFACGKLIQSDVTYRRKDSHLTTTDETIPKVLRATRREVDHILANEINLPVEQYVLSV